MFMMTKISKTLVFCLTLALWAVPRTAFAAPNANPVLAPIRAKSVNEGSALSFTGVNPWSTTSS